MQVLCGLPTAALQSPAQARSSPIICAGKPTRQHQAVRPLSSPARAAEKEVQPAQDPFAEQETYKDSWFDMIFIKYFAAKMSQNLGDIPYEKSYEGFVQLSREVMKGRNSKQQRETVAGVLNSLLPQEAQQSFKNLFPVNKFSANINAWITTLGFAWLVGPMELQESEIEFQGETQKWKSKVLIKKCRYLEASGCVGMCTNMCQQPTQTFFSNSMGLPLTMSPNFEDLSCEMVFGARPPALEDDPVYQQPCFPHVCKLGNRDAKAPCPKVDTSRKAQPGRAQ